MVLIECCTRPDTADVNYVVHSVFIRSYCDVVFRRKPTDEPRNYQRKRWSLVLVGWSSRWLWLTSNHWRTFSREFNECRWTTLTKVIYIHWYSSITRADSHDNPQRSKSPGFSSRFWIRSIGGVGLFVSVASSGIGKSAPLLRISLSDHSVSIPTAASFTLDSVLRSRISMRISLTKLILLLRVFSESSSRVKSFPTMQLIRARLWKSIPSLRRTNGIDFGQGETISRMCREVSKRESVIEYRDSCSTKIIRELSQFEPMHFITKALRKRRVASLRSQRVYQAYISICLGAYHSRSKLIQDGSRHRHFIKRHTWPYFLYPEYHLLTSSHLMFLIYS